MNVLILHSELGVLRGGGENLSRNLGEAMLSTIGRRIPLKSRLRRTWNRFQEAVSWRVISWHSKRFQRRIERELAGCWNDFDLAYVHGDPLLASKIANFLPTVLRLPGPISADFSTFLRKIHAVCANGDAR